MVEWDDFDWRKVAGAIIMAVLVIAGGIFVIEDYMNANRMKSSMDAQLKALNDFEQAYQPPGKPELDAMEAKIETLKKDLGKMDPKLGDTVDMAVVEKKIRGLAASQNVTLEKLKIEPATKENFMKVNSMDLVITGSNEALSKFLGGLENLGAPWRRHGEPSTSLGRVEMSIDFLAFDQPEWDKSYNCDLGVKVPENIDTNISKVRIFKTTVSDVAVAVESMQAKLADAKKSLSEKCDLDRQISGLETRIKRSRELAGK